MKFTPSVVVLTVLISVGLLVQSCSKNSSPAAPAPTPTFTFTNTVCTDGSGHTCTPTDTSTVTSTFTATSTATVTDTKTPTWTATATFSRTPTWTRTETRTSTPTKTLTSTATPTDTFTATLSPTNTLTLTVTNTPTVTLTSTVTDSPTATGTFTPTGSATSTNTLSPTKTLTFTLTPTVTPSPTFTRTATATVTNSPTPDPYRLTGSITYSGTKTTTGMYFLIGATTDSTLQGEMAWSYVNAAKNTAVPYTLNLPSAGTYYVVVLLEPTLPTGEFNPSAGDSYTAYNGQCLGGTFTGIPVTSPTTQNFSFNDLCSLGGLYGTISYTGCRAVNSASKIRIMAYSDAGYSNEMSEYNLSQASGSYSAAIPSGSVSAYVRVFVDLDRSGSVGNCEPYKNLGQVQISPASQVNISFDDTNLYGSCTTAAAFSGTLSATGGINSTHPVIVRAYQVTGSNWQLGGMTSVACSSGAFSLPVSTGTGSYVLLAEYLVDGVNGDQYQPAVGNKYNFFGGASSISGATTLNYTGSTQTGLNFAADSYQVLGYTGSVTYTGSKTLRTACSGSGPQIVVGAFDANSGMSIMSANLQASNLECSDTVKAGSYTIVTNVWGATAGTYALKVFYDADENMTLSSGDYYYNVATAAPNAGSPSYDATVGDGDLTAY